MKRGHRLGLGLVLAALLAGGPIGCNWPSEGMSTDPTRAYLDAKTALYDAASAADPNTRIHAIEAMASVMRTQAGGVFMQALSDEDEGVRFAAALAIGEVKYAPALPVLQERAKMYTGERFKRTYCAVLYALFRLGDTSRLSDLAEMLLDPLAPVRATAAQVMGMIGDPSAIGPLKAVLTDERDEGVKYNMREALAMLGDSASQALLESYVRGHFLDLRLAAIPVIAREYSPNTTAILRELLESRNPPRVRVLAAGAMGKLGEVDPAAYRMCIEAARRPGNFVTAEMVPDQTARNMELSSLQRLAAMSLGWMKNKQAVDSLYPLLRSPNGGVRVAAAMSIMRLLAEEGRPLEATPVAPPPPGPQTQPAPPSGPRLHTAGPKD